MSSGEQPKSGTRKPFTQVIKEGYTAVKDAVIGEDCNNCAKSTSKKRDDQYFCSDACYNEFNCKFQACAQGSPLCCLPGCQKQCYNGREFCGRTHGQIFKQEHKKSHLYCIVEAHNTGEHFQVHSYASPLQSVPVYHQSGGNSTTYSHHSTASASRVHTPTSPLMPATNQPIHFYHSWQPYYEFAIFSAYPIVVAGKRWPTSEHFFQAQKFVGTLLVEKIRNCHTPREAFDISHSELGTKWLRKDWSEEKENVMKLALRAKFTQHQYLHDLLLSTGDRKLVEHTDKDSFWGDGGDGSGQNKLGHMLMELRLELRCKKLHTNFTYPHSSQETTLGTFHDPIPCLASSRQPAISSQSAQQLHPSQSVTRSQASQLHGNHEMQVSHKGVLSRPSTATMFTRDSAAHLFMEDNPEIVQAFLTSWTKKPERKPKPTDIKGVFRIDNPTLKSRFDQYCDSLSNPNVSWQYHGTSIKCHLLQSRTFCGDTNCGICGISGVGFDKTRIGTHVKWFQRFGRAFCLAPNSSKCHEYTLGFGEVRALLYCQVALGNPHYTTCDMPTCQSPPPGYDSVYGQAGTHRSNKGTLNYDEVAIYGVSEAILPRYIIVYCKDGIGGLLR